LVATIMVAVAPQKSLNETFVIGFTTLYSQCEYYPKIWGVS